MRSQLDSETREIVKHHEQHMVVVIGRLLAAHARKQATPPSARLDPTLGKIQVTLPINQSEALISVEQNVTEYWVESAIKNKQTVVNG